MGEVIELRRVTACQTCGGTGELLCSSLSADNKFRDLCADMMCSDCRGTGTVSEVVTCAGCIQYRPSFQSALAE